MSSSAVLKSYLMVFEKAEGGREDEGNAAHEEIKDTGEPKCRKSAGKNAISKRTEL